MTTLKEFREKFQLDELTVQTTDHWTWSVSPVQFTLCSGVLSLNRLCPTFGEITGDEGRDLAASVRIVEEGLRAAFQADRFNYLMSMMNDIHVHMLAVPGTPVHVNSPSGRGKTAPGRAPFH
jgi:diadenosine tetraphosphate (Ap4A) HIT family hydrolase